MAPTSEALRIGTPLTAAGSEACPGCGALLPHRAGPTHAFLGASPACLALYERLGHPSSEHPDCGRVRRLLHDAYAVQHPGTPQLRSVRSVALHLMDLCVLLERDGEMPRPVPLLGRMPRRRALDLHWLEPPAMRGTITIVAALGGAIGEPRAARVEAWARDAWGAWAPHHDTVRRWLDLARPVL